MQPTFRSMAVVAMAIAASACSSSVSIDDLSHRFVTAECQLSVKCGEMADEAYCETLLNGNPSQQGINSDAAEVAAVKAGKVVYDGSAAAKCLDALSASACNAPLNFPDVPGCSAIFTGTLADGSACITDEECKRGSQCDADPNSTSMCQGICKPGQAACLASTDCTNGQVCDTGNCVTRVPAGAAGQPCGTFNACQDGLFCAQSDQGDPACQPIAQANQPCTTAFSGSACVSGYMCILTDPANSTAGTCLKPKTKGQACNYTFECGGDVSPLICDPNSKTCVDRPKSGACIEGNCDLLSAYCDVSQPSNPTCKPFKAIGESCTVGSDECGNFFNRSADCMSSGNATTGTCTATGSTQACMF